MRVSEYVCVSEEGGREGGGRRGADTELKTKTHTSMWGIKKKKQNKSIYRKSIQIT